MYLWDFRLRYSWICPGQIHKSHVKIKEEMKKIKTVIFGLGPLGRNLSEEISQDPRFELVALVDQANSLQGTKIAGITIQGKLNSHDIDLAFVTTNSRVSQIKSLVEDLCNQGINVISSCEELIFPSNSNLHLVEDINQKAISNKVKVLGTGINPGFLMDYMLIILLQSQILNRVKSITYHRIINTNKRRISFQNKVGIDMNEQEYFTAFRENKIGHVGFKESINMVCQFMSWSIEDYQETIEPIFKKQLVIGIQQNATVKCANGKKLDFVFNASSQNQDQDSIRIQGDEDVLVEFKTGVNGEKGTVAMLINTALRLTKLDPGFKTMLDLV